MSDPTITNTAYQWPPAGLPFGLPAAFHWPHYHHSHLEMGRRKNKGAYNAPVQNTQTANSNQPHEHNATQSYRPDDANAPNTMYPMADSWRPYHNQWQYQPLAQGFSATLPWRSQAPARHQNVQSRVSKPNAYSLVDSWRSYRADHIQPQEPAPPGGSVSSIPPPWRAHPQTPAQPSNQFRPQPPAFQPGQSRYNLTSRQQRPFSTSAADQIVQSVEVEPTQHSQLPFYGTPSNRPTRRREPTPINKGVTPVPVPQPSAAYIKLAQAEPKHVAQPRKLLVLLDLNGTLVYRYGAQRQHSVKRPGVDRLLEYLFKNHAVLIFTSATMKSAENMAKKLLTPQQYGELVTIRAREHLGLQPEQFRNKVQVYKDLNKIWSVPEVQQSATEVETRWDMTNTVLIDDSVEKARSHPHNLLQVPEFMHPASNSKEAQQKWTEVETNIMLGVEAKLEELKHRSSVACQIRVWQDGEQTSPGITSEKVDDRKLTAIKEGNVPTGESPTSADEPTGYPTPTSLRRDSSSANESGDDQKDSHGVKLPIVARSEVQQAAGTTKEDMSEKARAIRSPSPITEADFAWRYESTRAAKDW